MEADSTGTAPLSSAQKGLALLDRMASFPTSVGVSELARAMGWSRGTVHKWMVTLVSAGWVEQDGQGLYRLSLLPVRIANGALRQSSIDQRVFPFVEDLARHCSETVSLAIVDGDSALIIYRVESPQILSVNIRLGSRMPMATSASGVVLAAFSPDTTLARLGADGVELPAQERIDAARRDGIARSVDDLEVGMCAVAVPVLSADGSFCGALSLASPTRNGISDAAVDELLKAQKIIHHLIRGDS